MVGIMDNALLQIASFLAANGASEDRILETLKIASGPNPQRLLNQDERDVFAGAVARAVRIMPAFRDAIALIRPFRDYTTPTLYTDKFSRVGIGEAFFLDGMSSQRRATLLLHESMHVLNNHFTRKVDFYMDPSSENDAKDLEINSLLNRDPRTDLDMLLLPSSEPFKFPEAKSFEQYARYMKEKGMVPEEFKPPVPQSGPPQPQDESDEDPDSQGGDGSQESEPSEGSGGGDSDSENSEQSSSDEKSSSGSKSDKSDDSDSEDSDEGSSSGDGSEGDDSDEASGGGGSSGNDSEDESEGDSDGDSNSDSDGDSGEDSSLEDVAKEASEKSSANGKVTPKSSCDHSTSEKEKAADDLKIEPASSSEQAVARNNTIARLQEDARKARERGDRAALMMLQQMELSMTPSKVNWRIFFKNILTNCRDSISLGRSDYTYRRVNKRLSGEFIFPGMVKYEPSSMMGIDTSGSMTKKDLSLVLSELEAIVKSAMKSKDKFKAFCVDAAATAPKTVRSIKDLDLRGGGGTAMEMAIRSIELLPRKDHPDLFILATDGGTSWPAFKRELLKRKTKYRVIVLITVEAAFESARSQLQGVADVIDISDVRK